MPTERVVEVVMCVECQLPVCDECPHGLAGETYRGAAIAYPDSLTARMLDLADAVDRWDRTDEHTDEDEATSAWDDYVAALAAVRNHPDYRRNTND